MAFLNTLLRVTANNSESTRYKILYLGNDKFEVVDSFCDGVTIETFSLNDMHEKMTDVSWVSNIYNEEYKFYTWNLVEYLNVPVLEIKESWFGENWCES